MGGPATGDSPTLVIGNRNYSTWSLRAWFFLTHHGLAFETVRLPLDTDDFHRRIGEFSPSRTVPVLIHGRRRIWDSLAICEYACEQLIDADGWPESPGARAMARSASCEMHGGFTALRAELPMNCRARGRRVRPSDAARRDIERIADIWRESRTRHGRGGPWLFGRFSIADAMFAPVAMRFITYGIELDDVAASWVEALVTDPSMADWLRQAAAEPEVISGDERG